jgi:hypothetical protein
MAAQRQGREDLTNWKSKCLELAKLVNRHEKDRMIADKKAAWKLAREILLEAQKSL